MFKVKVIEDFTLQRFKELKNIVRNNSENDVEGKLFVNDTFECDEEMLKYLTKTNPLQRAFVEVVEVILKKKDDFVIDNKMEEVEKPKIKRTRKTIANK